MLTMTKKKYYKNLYERVYQEYRDLRNEYKMLKTEHGVLKRFYNFLVDEKESMLADSNEVKKHLNKCSILLNQPNADLMDPELKVFVGNMER